MLARLLSTYVNTPTQYTEIALPCEYLLRICGVGDTLSVRTFTQQSYPPKAVTSLTHYTHTFTQKSYPPKAVTSLTHSHVIIVPPVPARLYEPTGCIMYGMLVLRETNALM